MNFILKDTDVKLLSWKKIGNNVVSLYFERVPRNILTASLENRKLEISVPVDFGYVELKLTKTNIANEVNWLDTYLNFKDNLYVEEEFEGQLVFSIASEQYTDEYTVQETLEFDNKEIINFSLSIEEWQNKYIALAKNTYKWNNEREVFFYTNLLDNFDKQLDDITNEILQNTDIEDVNDFQKKLLIRLKRLSEKFRHRINEKLEFNKIINPKDI
ncbi:MAG: hypothetical protein IPH46_16445 [Bacteroidetes bacterium]|nr:hypothetical protein [Bacteroidota bacterium]